MYLDGSDFIFAGDRVVEMNLMFDVKEFWDDVPSQTLI
jgi:hypothetical protein